MTKQFLIKDLPGKFPSEEAALIKTAASDPAAFAQLYSIYIRRVYRYILSKLGETSMVEDLTSQNF